MNCIVKINGREAVPVRAIPFVTGWTSFSPDAVAEGLAHQLESGKFEGLTAYHTAQDGTVSAMLPKEWDGIVKELEALSRTLKAKETTKNTSYPLWREKSILVLPSHCFVWRDEFETSVNAWWSRLYLVNERPGDKALNFAPRVPQELVNTVFDGMPKIEHPGNSRTAPPESRSHVSNKLALLNQAAQRFWANADRDSADTHPKKSDVEAWLMEHGFSTSLASHGATIIRPDWAPIGRRPDNQ